MKLSNTVTMEYANNTWSFVDNGGTRIPFDQALVDHAFVKGNRVTGYVLSVHGLSQEVASLMDSRTRDMLGVKGIHSLSGGRGRQRVRLMPGGKVERVENL